MAQWLELGASNKGFSVWKEDHASYDGIAVSWGPNNKKASAEECAQHCYEWQPKGEEFPCNVWVFCPDDICFEPDAHKHTKGDCWLKFTELPSEPEVNQRGRMNEPYTKRHAGWKGQTQWVSGAVLPPSVLLGPGTMGPRAKWRR